jgi:hypothetical protein
VTSQDIDEEVRRLSRILREARTTPHYAYPWSGLEDELRRAGSEHFPCIGYGSLVNAESAARTLGPGDRTRVIAFGVRRVFNYEISERVSRYGPPASPKSRGALNVIVTGRPEDVVNGLLFRIPVRDLAAFRAREIGYDLVPVPIVPWDRRNEPPTLAYILSCPDESREGRIRTSVDVLPHRAYYKVCREGAASFGEDFLRFWLDSTYLADGITPVATWEVNLGRKGGSDDAASA